MKPSIAFFPLKVGSALAVMKPQSSEASPEQTAASAINPIKGANRADRDCFMLSVLCLLRGGELVCTSITLPQESPTTKTELCRNLLHVLYYAQRVCTRRATLW